jgi:hypothetical protein
MRAPWDGARQLQRPLPNTMLRIVASGEREDPPSETAQAQMKFKDDRPFATAQKVSDRDCDNIPF